MVKWTPKKTKIAAALAIVLAGGGWAYKKRKDSKNAEAPTTVEVSKGDIELRFVDAGELQPKIYVDIASKVSGRVISMSVDEGQRVKKGAKLCVIQPGRTEAEAYVPAELTSPLEGIVMRYQDRGSNNPQEGRISKLGDYVTGLMESNNPSYLMTVADLSKLIVKMKISEMDVLKLAEGMKVDVSIDALSGEKYPARITMISPQAEKDSNNLKSFKVEVSLDKNDPRLKPGMTARVDGLLEARRGVLKIPLSAVFEEGGHEVGYIEAKPKPRRVELSLGLRSETDAELLAGAAEGDSFHTEKPVEKSKS